jgi:hypothetical protein
MFFVATVLAILSGLFYAASHHEIGSLGVTMCQYGSPFCDNPLLVLTGAGLAALWGAFVSVRWCVLCVFEFSGWCHHASDLPDVSTPDRWHGNDWPDQDKAGP